jgi:hypothetical protein
MPIDARLMNHHPADTSAPQDHRPTSSSPLLWEVVLASIWLGAGLFVLPALIYGVGTALLGPYGENAGLGRFYTDFFADLARPAVRAWLIALGPLVLMSLLRLILLRPREARAAEPDTSHKHNDRAAHENPGRVEPRLGAD